MSIESDPLNWSVDARDMELIQTLREEAREQDKERKLAKLAADRSVAALAKQRDALAKAAIGVSEAEDIARATIKTLPESEQQVYYDRINAASGIGVLAASIEEPASELFDPSVEFID